MKGSKYCHKCNKWKALDDFYNDKYNATGKTSWCKECAKAHQREYNRTKNQNKGVDDMLKDFLTNLDYEAFDQYGDFTHYVVDNVLDNLEDNPHYLEQVVNFGLQSGICPQLIYHRDCKQVFDEYEEDIFTIYNEVRFDIKDSVYIDIDTLVWISYEMISTLLLEQYEYQKEYNEEC